MNYNTIAVIFSFLTLEEIGNHYFTLIKNNFVFDVITKYLSQEYKTDSFNIIGKICNTNNLCGLCHKELIGTYTVRLGLIDCMICKQKKNFNILLCNKCCKHNLFRGDSYVEICNNHKVIYYGVNLLSF